MASSRRKRLRGPGAPPCRRGATRGMRHREGRFMTNAMRPVAILTASLFVMPVTATAADDGMGRRIWHGVAATAMNVLPVVSTFASQRCLPGYIACKLSFAGMGLAASGVQIVAGGDLDGARETLGRAFGGDWVVTPHHLATGIDPDPYPAVSRDDADSELPSF